MRNGAKPHKVNLTDFTTPLIRWAAPDRTEEIERNATLITATMGQRRDGVAYPYTAYFDKLIERVRERLRTRGVSIFKYRDHRTNEFIVRAIRGRR